jgi:hypothetical protein
MVKEGGVPEAVDDVRARFLYSPAAWLSVKDRLSKHLRGHQRRGIRLVASAGWPLAGALTTVIGRAERSEYTEEPICVAAPFVCPSRQGRRG